jgi:hypothetical protein
VGFFSWFHFSNFMDTCQEWHAFVEGFCEVLCPWPPRYEISEELEETVETEHHYYVFGRVLGFMALIGFVAMIIKMIF